MSTNKMETNSRICDDLLEANIAAYERLAYSMLGLSLSNDHLISTVPALYVCLLSTILLASRVDRLGLVN